MIAVRIVSGDEAGRTFEFASDRVAMGRSPTNEVVLSDSHVSGDHAVVTLVGERTFVRDLGSTNGTRIVRGSEILDAAKSPHRELELLAGDLLELGDSERRLRLEFVVKPDQEDADDTTQIVSMRTLEDIGRVVAQVSADRELLHRLYEAQKRIASPIDLDAVMDSVAAEVFLFLPRATHMTLALREDEGGEADRQGARYTPYATRGRVEGSNVSIPMTRSVIKKVVSARAAVLAADAPREVGETVSLMAAQIQSTIGVPLWQGDDMIGVLQVDNRAQGMFRDIDLDVLAVLSQSAGQAVVHARLYNRLRIAEERQRKENVYLKRRDKERRADQIIGESAAMKSVFDQLRKVVDTRVTVLIEGETGTGKELAASAVHYWSNRRDRLFVAQNCAAMPENLLESELFGHKKGAFTGATDEKKGLFELADGGTLFLDEVGEMPLNLQAKLLRVLQEGEIRPVGGTVTKRVDVRIVAATNRDLQKEVGAGRFREDLFYRLRVFPLRLPPLRERRGDIVLLATHFMKKYAHEFGKRLAAFQPAAMELFQSYDWPGNIRELENEVQRLVIQLDDGDDVRPEHLRWRSPERVATATASVERYVPEKGTLRDMMDEVERRILKEALADHGGNKSATAKDLGITREGLHKKLKGLGIG